MLNAAIAVAVAVGVMEAENCLRKWKPRRLVCGEWLTWCSSIDEYYH